MKLTTKARKKIKTKNFAEPGKRAYPIEDRNHAINALARVSQNGSSSEKAQVRAAVKDKYPDLDDTKKKTTKKKKKSKGTSGKSETLPTAVKKNYYPPVG